MSLDAEDLTQPDAPPADISSVVETASCADCDHTWRNGGALETAATHASRYGHEIRYQFRVEIDGAAEVSDE